MKKAIVGIYRHDPRANDGAGRSTLVKTIDLEAPLKETVRRKGWKGEVMSKVQEEIGEHFNVLAVNLVHEGADLEVSIAVTVETTPPRLGQRRKPVTRGGASLDGPVKTGKTMAAKRRGAKR